MTTQLQEVTTPARTTSERATRRAVSESVAREAVLIDRSQALKRELTALEATRAERRTALARATADGADPKQLATLRRDLESVVSRETEVREALELLAQDRAALVEQRKALSLADAEAALAVAYARGVSAAETVHAAIRRVALEITPLADAYAAAYHAAGTARTRFASAGGDAGTQADRPDIGAWYRLDAIDDLVKILRGVAAGAVTAPAEPSRADPA